MLNEMISFKTRDGKPVSVNPDDIRMVTGGAEMSTLYFRNGQELPILGAREDVVEAIDAAADRAQSALADAIAIAMGKEA